MRIKKLILKNFRCYESLDITFDDNLSVLIGVNGSGKTTILEATSIAIGTILYGIDGVSGKSIDKKYDAFISNSELGGFYDNSQQFPVVIEATGIVDGKEITWKRTLNKENGNTTIKDAGAIVEISKDYQKRIRDRNATAALILPFIAYYGTGRLWDYHRQKKNKEFRRYSRVNGYIDCLEGTPNVKLMLEWLHRVSLAKSQRQRHLNESTPEIEVVYEAIKSCFEYITGYKNIEVDFNGIDDSIDVFYDMEDGKKAAFPLNILSDGYKGILSLVADIAYRMAVLNPQLGYDILKKTQGIILIDEIDLHLHPKLQYKILKILHNIFPQIQFIVTTHSPTIIQTAQENQIFILNNLKMYRPETLTYGRDINSIIINIMDGNNRPDDVLKLFEDLQYCLDNKDVENAKKHITELENLIGNDDPKFIELQTHLALDEYMNEK